MLAAHLGGPDVVNSEGEEGCSWTPVSLRGSLGRDELGTS